tara:strand:- start:31 stop:867 length:837 start_codon:yes stop_codon:yes gene_type:complete
MDTIIGLGSAGCNIAMKFSLYPQYKTICIDTEDKGYENYVAINRQSTHEDYEQHYTSLDLSGVSGHAALIVGGSGFISGASLRILEQLQDHKISIVYIRPDLDIITEKGRMRERIVFQVMQQYARSNKFERIYLIDNLKVEEIVGAVSIKEYWNKINETIASTLHMTNVFSHTQPEMSTFSNFPETAKISTVGLVDINTGEEKLFFDLECPREKLYYYAISEKELSENADLFRDIVKQVKSRAGTKARASYGIYSTNYDKNYAYTAHHASMIQGENIS